MPELKLLPEALLYFRDINIAKRRELAKNGNALRDGSYPIENEEDLHNAAILAKSGHGNVAAAKRLIAKRARELGVKNPLEDDDTKKASENLTKAAEHLIQASQYMPTGDADDEPDPVIPGHDDDYAQDIATGTMDDSDDGDEDMCHAEPMTHTHTTTDGGSYTGSHVHVNNDLTPIPMVPSASAEPRTNSAASPGQEFLTHLYRSIASHYKDNGVLMSVNDFNGYVNKARSHAGGSAPRNPAVRADNPSTQSDYRPDGPMPDNYTMSMVKIAGEGEFSTISGDVADLCASKFSESNPAKPGDPDARLFMPVSFAEPREWIPYLPKPGSHRHPVWGNVTITEDRNKNFVKNFKDGIYQSQLPLDAEHEGKLSGALAWVKDMRMNEDKSVDARVEYTDRGRTLLNGDAYKYFSPEFFNYWSPPESYGKVIHKDVAVGGAFTTRPFFKESALRSLVASERGIQVLVHGNIAPNEGKNTMPDENQIDAAQFSELKSQLESFKEAMTAKDTEIKQANERIAAMELTNRTARFTEEIMGGESGHRWFGETEHHLKHMEALAQAFGEDSDELKFYIEDHRASAAQMHTSSLFSERGRTGTSPASSDPTMRFTEMVKAKTTELGGAGHELDAMEMVARENPQLYADHQRAARTKID